MDTPAVQTLFQIVKGIEFQGYEMSDWNHIGGYAIDAIRDIHMFYTAQRYKVSKINVNQNTNTIDWPVDLIKVIYVAIPSQGKLWYLTTDNDIVPTTTLVNGQETLNSIDGEGIKINEGQTVGYGTTGGHNRYYIKNDELNRRTIINGYTTQDVFLAYVTSGISDKDTLIPVKFKKIIDYYVRMMLNMRPPENWKNVENYKDLYEQEISKLVSFESPSLIEIRDALLSTFSGTVQR
jgi:hypothetical protein